MTAQGTLQLAVYIVVLLALAWPLGAPGRGIATILEMVQWTRLDCVIGSAGIIRAATALALLAWSPAWLALLLLVVIGFGMLVTSVSVNMILQTVVEDDKRGRIMSLYTAAFLGMAPFGSLAAGALADEIGIASTLTLGGLCCALAASYIAWKRPQLSAHVEPIYARLGIVQKGVAGDS